MSNFFASSDDTVILPAYTRVDGTIFFKVPPPAARPDQRREYFRSALLPDRGRLQQQYARFAARGAPYFDWRSVMKHGVATTFPAGYSAALPLLL
jgi:hypothetical protein